MQKEILKEKIKRNYGKIAIIGNLDSRCSPHVLCGSDIYDISNEEQVASIIGYDETVLKSIPQDSILGLGCGAPLDFANLERGEMVVDLGSGAGIDAFLASKLVGKEGKVIGIDITDEMLEKATSTSYANKYNNVEFRKGDIEERIPIEDNSVDVV
ncbi:MAG: methyltransferase domain-containing protein, partial [Nitrososphaeraceae archaeon]